MNKEERIRRQRQRLAEMKAYEASVRGEGYPFLAGVDEVGRGPLAGPVVAACVVLPEDFDLLGVDDSKKLTERKRLELAPQIRERALAYGLGMASEKVIDEINILQATMGAMRVAVDKAAGMLKERHGEDLSLVLIDALTLPELPYPQRAIIRGDSASLAIAAASILAKVTRDDMMIRYEDTYPGYGFASNKGYGTKAHYEGLARQGPCPIHRRSFLRSVDRD